MNKYHKKLLIGILFIILFSQSVNTYAKDTGEVYTFGVVPQQAASKLARLWMPLLKNIGEKSKITFRFRTAPDIPTFEQRLGNGEYDFAYMNPYHYTYFHDRIGVEAIAKEVDKKIIGIVVVNEQSTIKDIHELNGLKMAFPAPAAFAATILPLATFKQMGIDVKPVYVNSHDSVYRAVAANIYVAGGGIQRTLKNIDSIIQDELKILWKTQPYTPHAIAHHPRVDKNVVELVQQALLNMSQSTEGMQILNNLEFKGFEKAVDADWNDVRMLHIELLNKE